MKKLFELTKDKFGILPGGLPNRIPDPQMIGEQDDHPDLEITKVTADSRQVVPGALFVALKGLHADGHEYLPEAANRGASVLVGERADPQLKPLYIRVHDSRYALAHLAAAWYGYPAQEMVMIGVTGTDGKTTTCTLLFEILRAAGIEAGLITSVHAQIEDQVLETGLHVTTPEALEVQQLLAQMVDKGVSHCVIEATSHGLAQHRVAACNFDLGLLTNITHEHIDYHGTFQAYREAKASLFSGLSQEEGTARATERRAILNLDDRSYSFIAEVTTVPISTYGFSDGADYRAASVEATLNGLDFKLIADNLYTDIHSPLLGDYNVMNCLGAIATAVDGLGISMEAVKRGIAGMSGVPGRMERIDLGQSFLALVDFAHTPNSLHQVLLAARKLCHGKVINVFGSAGLRDPDKRQMMAKTSVELADLTVLTAEDPRTESLDAILEAMAEGAIAGGGVEGVDFFRIPDRREAIRQAVQRAGGGDLLIVCGKGHEQSMCFGEQEYPWDDRVALRAALSERLGLGGPEMPSLPKS